MDAGKPDGEGVRRGTAARGVGRAGSATPPRPSQRLLSIYLGMRSGTSNCRPWERIVDARQAGVSLNSEQQVILRAEDQSGTASLVALLSPDQALTLADALMQSAEAVEATVGRKSGLAQRPPIAAEAPSQTEIRKAVI